MFFFIALVNGVLTSRVRRQEGLHVTVKKEPMRFLNLLKSYRRHQAISDIISIATKNIKKHFKLDPVFILQDGNNNLKGKFLKTFGYNIFPE